MHKNSLFYRIQIAIKHGFYIYFKRDFLIIMALGFNSGVPFLLILSTLSFWLSELGATRTAIGFFAFATMPYAFKAMWAPFLEQIRIPCMSKYFGIKRSWGLIAQLLLIISIIILGHLNPLDNTYATVFVATLVAFCAATQDIVIDALRIDILSERDSGAGAAVEVIGFRLGMLTSGAGALYLSSSYGWAISYTIMALLCIIGIIALLSLPQQRWNRQLINISPKINWMQSMRLHLVMPWQQLLREVPLHFLLLFIFFLKFGDIVLNAMVPPFLYDLGFSKIEYANISKFLGVFLIIGGSLIGGIMIHKLGLLQSLIMSISLQAICGLLFVIQALIGHHLGVLVITIGVESLTSGIIATIFISYLSSFCKNSFSGSNFTLLYSFGSLCRIIVSGCAGWVADQMGWCFLFICTSLAFFPTLWCIIKIHNKQDSKEQSSPLYSQIKQLFK